MEKIKELVKKGKNLYIVLAALIAGGGAAIGVNELTPQEEFTPVEYEVVEQETKTDAEKEILNYRYWEVWIEYEVGEDVAEEKEGVIPDVGLSVKTYRIHKKYIYSVSPPTIKWVNDRLTPPYEGAVATRFVSVRKL